MVTCLKCGETKPETEFGVYRATTGRRRRVCKMCMARRERQRNARLRAARERLKTTDPEAYGRQLAKQRERGLAHRRQVRADVLNHYGRVCVCCGDPHEEFLTIDHVNGGGNTHRKAIGTDIYHWLRHQGYPTGFQTMCFNCNYAKHVYGVCPHRKAA